MENIIKNEIGRPPDNMGKSELSSDICNGCNKDEIFSPNPCEVGFYLYGENRYQEACDTFKRLIDQNNICYVLYHYYGKCLMKLQQYQDASYFLELALLVAIRDEDLLQDLAELHSNVGNNIRAINFLARLTDLIPENSMYHYKLGLAFYNIQNTEDALNCIDRALEIDPTLHEAIDLKNKIMDSKNQ